MNSRTELPAGSEGAARGISAESALGEIFSRLESRRLDNGMTVCRVVNRQAPLVSTSLWYRVGARHETGGLWGAAHFLEHMMFKGSARFGPGVLDELTQAAGGDNNAFTSHDATSYYFSFASDRWKEALDFEADRMESLTLDAREVESERSVIEEEISMYEDDPWDSLELEVQRRFYGGHPYGRSILGSKESLAEIGSEELRSFYRQHYRPGNAVLVVAGDIDDRVFVDVESRFARIPDRVGTEPDTNGKPDSPEDIGGGLVRFERRRGETARLVAALAAPPAWHEDYAALSLVVTLLGRGRSSRFHRALVDEGRLCASVSADSSEMVGPGTTVVAAEAVPGTDSADRARIEEVLWHEVERVVTEAELERARRLLLSDWVFGLERIGQQAALAGSAVTLFSEDFPARFLDGVQRATVETVAAAARLYLDRGQRGVVGWSIPEEDP